MDPVLDFQHSYRLQRAANTADLPAGSVESYTVHCGSNGAPEWTFLFSKKAMGGLTTVLRSCEQIFQLERRSGIGGMSWEAEGPTGARGAIKAPGLATTAWSGQIGSGSELQMLDATRLKDKVLRNVLNGWPDAYHLMREERIIGYICREERNPKQTTGWLGKVKRLFADSDWVLRLESPLADDELLTALCLSLGTIIISVPADRS